MTNGREYLLEYAKDKADWLKALIFEAIETNCEVTEEKIDHIIDSLLYGEELEICECSVEEVATTDVVKLVELIHKQGVNALANNQTIKFCDDVNILYGLNGTGKSSYFRILNEVVGGNQKKVIMPNINVEEPVGVEVDIAYEMNGTLCRVEGWDASSRSLVALNKCMVYDTSYQNGLLDVRRTNETLVEPLGLHLFSYLTDVLDKMGSKVDSIVDDLVKQKPDISIECFEETVKTIFVSGKYTDALKKEIEKKYEISKTEIEALKKYEQDRISLKQIDHKDRITLYNNQAKSLASLVKLITETHKKLNGTIDSVSELVLKYEGKKIEAQQAQQRHQVFKDIPKSDTKEWKSFIEAGCAYTEIATDNINGVCPYCRQDLRTSESIGIVEAYSQFLKDRTQVELAKINRDIADAIEKTQGFIVKLLFQENIKSILEGCEVGDDTLFNRINSMSEYFEEIKTYLVSALEKRSFTTIEIDDVSELIESLDSIRQELRDKVDTCSKKEQQKIIALKEIEKKLKKLNEKKSIHNQRLLIAKWFEISDDIKTLKQKKTQINSRSLSFVSRKAHEDLLTEALKEKFIEELRNIGMSNLDVELQSKGIRKGVSSTKLVIKNIDDIKMILSEGEQRAIALSLFIAEVRLQNDMNPIILDDPVNSLDHKIAGRFAERLLKLDNQIILFIHNRLFLDSFESSRANHICKTINTDCNSIKGKHIRIYEVISHGKNNKGVLRQYKGSKLKDKIRELESVLGKQPFEEDVKVANLIRLAVESAVDEVIFNYQVPTKFSNKNSRIDWAALKKIRNDDVLVDKLKEIHDRTSGGSMHNGTERTQNPIEFEEYRDMVDEIKLLANIS